MTFLAFHIVFNHHLITSGIAELDAALLFGSKPSAQNALMKFTLATQTILLGVLASPAFTVQEQPSWPRQDELRAIQRAAFDCSRENSPETCKLTRDMADPLMDHPSLPGICKDLVWTLLEESRVAVNNDFRRRDAIDEPARRITTSCAKPAKRNQSKSKLNR